ncbi:acyl carrier protein [Agrobacterium rosae]|uniref:Acyl carrier protein n=1 Tax=Agrobacterium rosae TaxID=1972867 RepID=A0AAW9FJE7_9HYPH|nr:acyl carrier protein [Agrobacterium rosae]MDX8305539.1 acyl carrier protein [Agrobacterium rosae]
MSDFVYSAITVALSEVTERHVPPVTGEMRLDRDFDLDSFMFVQFLLSLEDKIGDLRFDPMSIGQADFNSVGNLVEYISAQVYDGAQ